MPKLRLLLTDISHLQIDSGFAYLVVILDAWSRKVVGYAMETRLTLADLERACLRSTIPTAAGNTPRKAYRDRLEHWGIRGSMSRIGNPHDNAKARAS